MDKYGKATHKPERLRIDKDELFRFVGYEPHAGQAPMHASTARFRVLACGARFGKSVAAAMEVVAALLEPAEKVRGWIVAPSRDLVDRIFERVLATFREHFRGRIVEEDARSQRLVVRNLGGGISEVRGKSADNAVSLLGESLDFLVVDEAAKLPRSTWEQCLSARLIDRRGWALLVSSPSGTNFFFHLYRRGQGGRDPDFASWCSPSWDNPHIDRATIDEERKRLPSDVFDEQYAAKFIGVHPSSCDTCGKPDADVPSTYVHTAEGDIPRCRDCDGMVDAGNHTIIKLWPNGVARTKVLIIRPESEEEPEPAFHEPIPEPPGVMQLVVGEPAPGLEELDLP